MYIDTQKFSIVKRINKFVVKITDGKETYLAHTGNTGKLSDLLVPGKKCYCTKHDGRATIYKLIAIEDHKYAALIEPRIHEKCFEILVNKNKLPWIRSKIVKKNVQINNHRIDFLLEDGTLVELKSALGRIRNYSFYPDTRSRRGEEHIKIICEKGGLLVFVSGMLSSGIVPGNRQVYELLRKCKGKIKGIGLVFWDDRVWLYNKNLPTLLKKPEALFVKE